MKPLVVLFAVLAVLPIQRADPRESVLRTHIARTLAGHTGESILPLTATVDPALRCFGRVCTPTPMPAELLAFLRDTAHVQIERIDALRTCTTGLPVSCTVPPSRALLQVFEPFLAGDSAYVAHTWYEAGGSTGSYTHGEEDVYVRAGQGWRFVRVKNVWQS